MKLTKLELAEKGFKKARTEGSIPFVLVYSGGYDAHIGGFVNRFDRYTAKELIDKMELAHVPGEKFTSAYRGTDLYLHPDDINKL